MLLESRHYLSCAVQDLVWRHGWERPEHISFRVDGDVCV